MDEIESPDESTDEPLDDSPARVCPFRVAVDTREQAPYRFLNVDPWIVVPLQTDVPLATGDYSICGFEDRLTIERKSMPDLLGSITAGRERFEREFERMAMIARHQDGGFAAVVVEAELSDIKDYCDRPGSLLTFSSVIGTVNSWAIRYGVHWWFCPGRRFAEILTLKLLCQFWRIEKNRVASQIKGVTQ